MNINSACILEDRGILFIDGVDAKDFLQNIITNDINKVNDHNSCFAALLNLISLLYFIIHHFLSMTSEKLNYIHKK